MAASQGLAKPERFVKIPFKNSGAKVEQYFFHVFILCKPQAVRLCGILKWSFLVSI
jgi:hypothetical protein